MECDLWRETRVLCFVATQEFYSKEVISLGDLNLLNHQQIGKHVPHKVTHAARQSVTEREKGERLTKGDGNMEIHFRLGLNHPNSLVESAKNRKVHFGVSSAWSVVLVRVGLFAERKPGEIVTQPEPVAHVVHISHTRIQFSFFRPLFPLISASVPVLLCPKELNGC